MNNRAIMVRRLFGFLSMGVVGTSVGLVRESWARQASETARTVADRQRDNAIEAQAEAEAVTRLLSEALASIDPDVAQGRQIAVREILDDVADRLENEALFSDRSLAEATLRTTIGTTYMSLGLYDTAAVHLETALAIRSRELGDEHSDVAASQHNLAKVLAGPAQCLTGQGDFARAEPLYRQALATRRKLLGIEHPAVAESLQGLGVMLDWTGRFAEAEEQLREGLTISKNFHGPEHLAVASMLGDLADVIRYGNRAEAEQLAGEALAIRRKLLGEQHPAVAESLHLLGHLTGDRAERERLYREAIAMRCRLLGNDHPLVGVSLRTLAVHTIWGERRTESEVLLRRSVEIFRSAQGDDSLETGRSRSWLGWSLIGQGRYAEAEQELLAAHHVFKRNHREDSSKMFTNVTWTLHLYKKWGSLGNDGAAWLKEEAEPLLQKLVEKARTEEGEQADEIFGLRLRLGMCLKLLGHFDQAEQQLLQAYNSRIAAGKGGQKQPVHQLVELYDAWGMPEQAAHWRAKLPSKAGR